MREKCSCRRESLRWHRNAWDLRALKFCDSDGFPRRICRNCYKRLKQFSEFKALCLNSRTDQERELRLKRGIKVSESPSVVQQREAKRVKGDGQVERSEPSPMKSLQFALIYPQEKFNEVAQPERESDLGKKGRILPQSIWPVLTQTQYDEGLEILAKSGLCNSEVGFSV